MLEQQLKNILNVDLFSKGRNENLFIGRPYNLDYNTAKILISDAWKHRANGIPHGSFLLAFYDGEEEIEEAILLRVTTPSKLPTDNDVVSSMIEYYKGGTDISGRAGSKKESKLDDFTRYEFSFSGLECRVLGAFYKIKKTKISNGEETTYESVEFGADLENFYSANNYKVFKATNDVLRTIVNQRDSEIVAGNENEFKIGYVRYSSSRRFQAQENDVEVFISPQDFIGKRTALFGMTRTGKSNTVKKIIEATAEISSKTTIKNLPETIVNTPPFSKEGSPAYPIGQIIFDVNGEYANPNMQDEGTAIYELYIEDTQRYSVLEKEGFEIMKVNFYNELVTGFSLISNHFKASGDKSDYVGSFLATSLEKPDDYEQDQGVKTRFDRKAAAYQCCLHKAGFPFPLGHTVKFQGAKELNEMVREENVIDPKTGVTLEEATIWFTRVWENYKQWSYLTDYPKKKGKEWADEELKAILGVLTRHKEPGSNALVSGYLKLKPLVKLHSKESKEPFERAIIKSLREGKIVIVDLSQGDGDIQSLYSERICNEIFISSMNRFIDAKANNFIQFYFEEAHNLFPKKDDKDLTQIYNKIAKEGAKLSLGMIYATQEVSSVSSNILKNTQNWFIAHLNNEDELKELRKYYDFSDFMSSLLKFSSGNDKGFVRMKTYTNPFVVPVQIDRFLANRS